MFVSTLVTAISVALALSGGAPTGLTARRQSEPPRVFFVSGHGWGHGVGMSQYGAQGFALHGWTYDRIVAHYFPATSLGAAPVTKVRVLLGGPRRRVTVSAKQGFALKDGAGQSYTLPAGAYTFGPGFKLKVDPAKPPKALPGPLQFSPGVSPLSLDGRAYRGSLQVSRNGAKLQVVNVVGLERYLWGVVPSEMPRTWAPEALKAQAVAARSYALAHLRGGAFDLYDDTRSQVYLGIGHESPAATAAVNATAGKVLLYRGHVADALFFSTSGGRTAAVQDVWPASAPIPYLVSVPDPYDSISPYHDWGPYRYAARSLAKRLHVLGRLIDAETVTTSSGRVRTVVATGSGGQNALTGAEVRSALGLRSTWFDIGVLALSGPGDPVVFGSRATLTGLARGADGVKLQARPYGGTWRDAGPLSPRNGAVAPLVKPQISTSYRLAVGSVAGTAVRVAVAPFLRLHVPNDRTGFWGVVRPALAGTVAIQRLGQSGWTTVAKAPVDKAGKFTAQLAVQLGSYRARLAPGHGFAAGTSPLLKVGSP
jgi:stage II sporulation protein D